MAPLNPSIFKLRAFFMAISIGFVACYESKQEQTLPVPLPVSKNVSNFLPLYVSSIRDSMDGVSRASEDFGEGRRMTRQMKQIDPMLQSRIGSCRELLSLALYNLNMSSTMSSSPPPETLNDIKTWLCAAMADLETCLDGFEHAPEEARNIVAASMESSRKLVGDTLSIVYKIEENPSPGPVIGSGNDWPPSWLSSEDRKLLFDSTSANVVVAKDGSGNYKTINEAIKVVPQSSETRFVIYVKQGIYNENVKIDSSRWNVMIYGDGMDKTIVSGKLSSATGQTTLDTATFGAHGAGFIARDMGFQNTAGPNSNQAVALASTADKSVFYKCSIAGYQDTLFTQSNRQFYRECYIYGTVDFIFGLSAAVFQNCTISVRKPLDGQVNAITAQGKSDPRCLSGFSIHKCNIVADEDLGKARTFLGRPWKNFSTTVFMESFLGSLIDPQGWLMFTSDVPPDTIYYGEYMNKGPGSGTAGRVKWKGVKVNMNDAEAKNFTVREFIGGDQWIPQTGVPFLPDF